MTPQTPITVGHVGWSPDYGTPKMPPATGKLKPVDLRRLVLRDDFGRGYFCAVAVYLKESCQEGVADTMAKSLFRQGGDWKRADPEDIETFRLHGLIPAENVRALAPASDGKEIES